MTRESGKSLRLVTVVAFGLAAWAVTRPGPAAPAPVQKAPPGVMSVRGLRIVDKQGKVRIELDCSEGGAGKGEVAAVRLLDPLTGADRVALRVFPDGMSVVSVEGGGPAATISADSRSSGFGVLDSKGESRIRNVVKGDRAGIEIAGADGKVSWSQQAK